MITQRTQAETLGIDDNYISTLVDTFYSRVQADESLGPIFAEHIGNWDLHLPKMKDFWASVIMGAGRYTGRPMPAHIKLRNEVNAEHFSQWLALFRKTLEDTAGSPEIVEFFMTRADRIAQSLQMAMFSGFAHGQ